MRSRISGRYLLAGVLALVAFAGCSGTSSRRVAAKPEPPLLDGGAPATIVEAPPATSVTWADRHPLFARPKQYYDSTNSGKLGKTARATFVGVPSGFVGEIKQIVVGQPASRIN